MALNLLRKHRLWERFLADVLGLPWDVVHTEAHRLEHATSDEVAERLAAVLDNPETCPHGLPVPGPDGELTPRSGVLLSELEPGSRGVVIRVIRETAPLLSHLEKLGLTLGAVVEVRSRDPFDGAMLAAVRGVERAFGRTVTETVVVERLQGGDRGEDA
jgi:DtxR family Mn-dependent transcriptional regulator